VNSSFPPATICEMEASIGNSVPSARIADSVSIAPMVRLVTPVSPKLRMCLPWAPWNRCGIKRTTSCPTASAAGQPNICSAAELNRRMRWSRSTVMIASMADPRIPDRRSWLSCKATVLCSTRCSGWVFMTLICARVPVLASISPWIAK